MCTALVSFDPSAAYPLLLVGVRDEFLARSWLPPDRHWPDRPGLVGGRDLRAGGTWLAVETTVPRAACVLNGRGLLAPEDRRSSRGELPLRAAATGGLGDLDPARFDPFHLLCADAAGVRLWSWDGHVLDERSLEPGLHMIVNSGLEGEDGRRAGAEGTEGAEGAEGAVEPAAGATGDAAFHEHMSARIAYFRPRFAAAPRPDPGASGWGGWRRLAEGAGLDPADHRALVVRHDLGGRTWGTTSISLVALGRGRLRYDFTAEPGVPGSWRTVLSQGGAPAAPAGPG